MTQPKDTRTNPFGARDYPAPSNMTRIGNGLRFRAVASSPTTETDGVPVQDWTSVHVIFYADEFSYTDLVAVFRPWRWYDKQIDGQSGISNAEVGRWVPDYEVTVALDPARINATVSSHYVWDTRSAAKMYWQLLGVYDSENNAGTVPAFVIAQPFGYGDPNDSIAVAVSSSVGGSTDIDINAVGTYRPALYMAKATHWSPVNGVAAFTTGVTLTCAGFPFVVDDANCEVLAVVVRKATGAIRTYINGYESRTLSATANVITLGGAGLAPFAAGDLDYYVYLLQEEKAYEDTTDSYRSEEIYPLDGKYTAVEYAVNDNNVIADPGATYVPSINGYIMDGYKDICFEVYLKGGVGAAAANRTVTLTFEGCNDLEVTAVRQWVPLATGYSLANDLTQASWTSTGVTTTTDCVDFDNFVQRRIRIKYDWDGDPSVTPGAIVVTVRRKAL